MSQNPYVFLNMFLWLLQMVVFCRNKTVNNKNSEKKKKTKKKKLERKMLEKYIYPGITIMKL